jgi:hypothetical protein
LSVQLILNLEEVLLIVICNEVNCKTKMTKSSRSTYSVKVCFGESRKVKIDDYIDSLNIDTSGKDVSADKASGFTILEVMVNSASVLLLHF